MEKNKVIAVIDLKAFYSYVECVDRHLDPWKTPLVVADKERGKNTIILSVTPYLKSKGVPSRLRIRDLPKGFDYIYAVPRMARYIEKSSEIINIILDFISEEDLHVYSIDEAFLDLTSYLNYYHKTAYEIVLMIINRIHELTGLEATAGIGPNFFLAKVALDIYAKKEHNGIAIMNMEDVKTKLWPITPLNKIWGIGERTQAKLNAFGIFNVEQLANSNLLFLKKHFGIMGEQLFNHANGIDETDMHEVYIPKEHSLNIGQVLFKDYNKDNIKLIIREMCDDLASRLRKEGYKTSLVYLFIGYSKEGGFARQMSLLTPTSNTETLYKALLEIFNKYIEDYPIRRVGLSFGKFKPNTNQQLSLFDDSEKEIDANELYVTIDKIHQKYGNDSILRASALTSDSTQKERNNFIGGHRK